MLSPLYMSSAHEDANCNGKVPNDDKSVDIIQRQFWIRLFENKACSSDWDMGYNTSYYQAC